ncbi:acid phosphatase, putative [Cordyceps militaris CM01]|uniref:3-phytase n=1 Tax=Cordyceps militaris (strain CM01) TaxID=983644 RepID=G3JQ54_CORMM|nr:acid phosphatase, putative [Cordyceps militaris CM01]EGX89305.1 acid phosphatase, putative [Cordyceps militaris CM01]
MSLEPRAAYTSDELARLYPPPLELQQVQILMRHGERTPVSNRFAESTGLPEFWPYCSQAAQMTSLVLDPASSTWTALAWRRHLETFSSPTNQTPVTAAAANNNSSSNMCELGQLTDKGRATTTALGARLRRLYVDQLGFLPATLASADGLYLRATPMPRALESMQQALHGLYPPATARAPDLAPLTVHTRHWADDTLLPNTANCTRFRRMMRAFGRRAADRWDASPEMDRINAKLQRYMPPAADSADPGAKTRIGVASHPALVGIMDTVAATAAHDGAATKLPREFYDAQIRADSVRIVVDEWFAGFRESSEYRTLGIGGLLADMTERMVGSAEGVAPHSSSSSSTKTPLRFGLSGCHDTTLAATVISLGGDGPDGMSWPPFTSHVAVELLRDTRVVASPPLPSSSSSSSWVPRMLRGAQTIGRRPTYELTSAERERLRGYYVRVRYNDEPVRIPGCRPAGKHYEDDETLCTLTAFKSIVDRITPTDWKAQCGANMDKPTMPSKPEPAGY